MISVVNTVIRLVMRDVFLIKTIKVAIMRFNYNLIILRINGGKMNEEIF